MTPIFVFVCFGVRINRRDIGTLSEDYGVGLLYLLFTDVQCVYGVRRRLSPGTVHLPTPVPDRGCTPVLED